MVRPGQKAVLAVLIGPQPNPGIPHEHTLKKGMGKNGGISAIDGPTFLSAIGWDWIPAIRDRNTGIWQKVFISATGPVTIGNPLITSDLQLPGRKSADVQVSATVANSSSNAVTGELQGTFGGVAFQQTVTIPSGQQQGVNFSKAKFPQLHIINPRLWWPNSYGSQNLDNMKLTFKLKNTISDVNTSTFGIRKITYSVPDAENLIISVNGVRVFCKGGNWGHG